MLRRLVMFAVGAGAFVLSSDAGAAVPIAYVPPSQVPAGAMVLKKDHSVAVQFDISKLGFVENCRVRRRGKDPVLDAESCKVLTERARFAPGRSASGVPVSTKSEIIMQWRAPYKDGGAGHDDGGVILLGSVGDLVSSDDYPSEALSRNERGTVVYSVEVTETGRPRDCQIVSSSGSPSLDQTTCRVILERARFIAASDGAGGRKRARTTSQFRWESP